MDLDACVMVENMLITVLIELRYLTRYYSWALVIFQLETLMGSLVTFIDHVANYNDSILLFIVDQTEWILYSLVALRLDKSTAIGYHPIQRALAIHFAVWGICWLIVIPEISRLPLQSRSNLSLRDLLPMLIKFLGNSNRVDWFSSVIRRRHLILLLESLFIDHLPHERFGRGKSDSRLPCIHHIHEWPISLVLLGIVMNRSRWYWEWCLVVERAKLICALTKHALMATLLQIIHLFVQRVS